MEPFRKSFECNDRSSGKGLQTRNCPVIWPVNLKKELHSFTLAAPTEGFDGNLYGTTISDNNGTVFQITRDGKLTTLIPFNGTNGSLPQGSLTLGRDGSFYGATFNRGLYGYGSLYRFTVEASLEKH